MNVRGGCRGLLRPLPLLGVDDDRGLHEGKMGGEMVGRRPVD